MKNDEIRLMMSAVKQYYQLGISQAEIAKREYVSKSTISKLLNKAVEMGYVEFKINFAGESIKLLQQKFRDVFGISCTILPCFVDDYLIRLNDICSYAAGDLEKLIPDNEIVGVTWGRTTEYLAKNMIAPHKERTGIKVCMLSGFVTGNIPSMKATHIIEKFSDIYNARGYVIPAPLLVDSAEIAGVLLSDSNINYVMNLCKKSQTVILSIGGQDLNNTVLTDAGEFSSSTYKNVVSNGAVGDIAGRYFDIHGNEIVSDITSRIISLSLEEIKNKRNRIAIAVGEYKSRAILGALRGKIVNKLYTDELTARAVLSELPLINNKNKSK